MSTKRTCPACNEEVIQGDEYCAACGASLSGFWMNTWTSPPPQDPTAADDEAFIPLTVPHTPQRNRQHSRTMIVLIVAAIILIGGILAMTYILTREDDEREPQTSASGSTSLDTSFTDIADATGGIVVPVAERIDAVTSLPTQTTPDTSSRPPETTAVAGSEPHLARLGGQPRDSEIVDVLITTIQAEGERDDTFVRPLP